MEVPRLHATHFLPVESITNPLQDCKATRYAITAMKKCRSGVLGGLELVDHVLGGSAVKTLQATGKVINYSIAVLEVFDPLAETFTPISVFIKGPLELLKIVRIPSNIADIIKLSGFFNTASAVSNLGKGVLAVIHVLDMVKVTHVAATLGTIPVLNLLGTGFTASSAVISAAQSVKNLWNMRKTVDQIKEKRAFWKIGLTDENVDKRIEDLQKRKLGFENSTVEKQLGVWNARRNEVLGKRQGFHKFNVIGKSKYSWHSWRAGREIKAWTRINNNAAKKENHNKPALKKIENMEKKIGKWKNIQKNLDSAEEAHVNQINSLVVGNQKKWKWKLITARLDQAKEVISMGSQALIVGVSITSVALLFTGYGGIAAPIVLSSCSAVAAGVGVGTIIYDFGKARWLAPKGEKGGHWNMIERDDETDSEDESPVVSRRSDRHSTKLERASDRPRGITR